jgi:hypothetical protein
MIRQEFCKYGIFDDFGAQITKKPAAKRLPVSDVSICANGIGNSRRDRLQRALCQGGIISC